MLSGGFKAAAVAAARRRRSDGDETPTHPEGATRASERGGGDSGRGGASLLSWVLGRPTATSAPDTEHPPLDVSPTIGRKTSTLAGPSVVGETEDWHDDCDQQPAELWNEMAGGGGGGLPQFADMALSDDTDGDTSVSGGDVEREGDGEGEGEGEGGAARAGGGWVAQARVQDLLGESRRLDIDSLQALLRALIATVHSSLPLHERQRRYCEEAEGVMDNGERESGGDAAATAEAGCGFEELGGFRFFHPQRRT